MNTVGIIGGGQLGQMLGQAARSIGLECVFLDPSESPPAATEGPVICAAFDDLDALRELASRCDVITYEFENVPVDAVRKLDGDRDVFPPDQALQHAQDRLHEKGLFDALGIPVPGYRAIDTAADLSAAADELGLPLVVKTRRLGYDGKGQAVLRDAADIESLFDSLGGNDLIAEQFVPFDYEVSAIGSRSVTGHIVTWPLSRNEHEGGILRVSRAPVADEDLTERARTYLDRLLDELDYVGTLALELFVAGDKLLANEFAPRVHNSGHWTIEGATTSQFENHIRAVTGLPLLDPVVAEFPGMVNIIGDMPAAARSLGADAHLHDYGKEPRPGRKLAHVTIVGKTAEDRERRLTEVCDALRQ